MEDPILDKGIALTGALFLLSVISERITNFLKLWLPESWFGSLRQKQMDEAAEKIRERKILAFSIGVGFFTAMSVQASMLHILSNIDRPEEAIGWNHVTICFSYFFSWENWKYILGFLLTGCFISLGSKFWHDLLDLLLEVKNVKAQISDSMAQKNNAGDFSALDTAKQDQLIKDAIQINYERWKNQYTGITGVGAGIKYTNNKSTSKSCLVFHVSQKIKDLTTQQVMSAIPDTIYYAGYEIPTDIIESGLAQTLAAYCGDETPRHPGGSISMSKINETGTIGLKVYQRDADIVKAGVLTCFHVLFPALVSASGARVSYYDNPGNAPSWISPGTACGGSMVFGKIMYGKLGPYVDGALCLSDEGFEFDPVIKNLIAPTQATDPTSLTKDVTIMKKMGMMSGLNSGVLKQIGISKDISFKGIRYTLNDLYAVQMYAELGDSGSAVISTDNSVAGILVAIEGDLAFISPISYYLTGFNISLTK